MDTLFSIQFYWGYTIMGYRKLNGNFNIISKNLLKYRNLRGLSQPDLSRELALLGVTLYNNDIYKIEHNKRTVKDYELYALMEVLNVTFEQLTEDAESKFSK